MLIRGADTQDHLGLNGVLLISCAASARPNTTIVPRMKQPSGDIIQQGVETSVPHKFKYSV